MSVVMSAGSSSVEFSRNHTVDNWSVTYSHSAPHNRYNMWVYW